MFKQLLDKVQGADIPMIASLLIFFCFFVLLFGYLAVMDKRHASYMGLLPVENDETIA
jgi:hypothetical protein